MGALPFFRWGGDWQGQVMAEESLTVNGNLVPFVPTLVELMARHGVEPSTPGVAVAVGEEVIPRRLWPTWSLKPGDEVEIVAAVQGG